MFKRTERKMGDRSRGGDRGTDRRGSRDFKSKDFASRGRRQARFQLAKGAKVDYKDIALVSKFVSDRGKILSRRMTGVSAKEQRIIVREVKKARFLGLLPILGGKRK